MIAGWLALAHAASVGDVANPRARGGWVTDEAGLLTPPAAARLEARLERLHADLDVEIAVVTVETVDAPTPKEFATALFDHWGVGDRDANNGLLVLVVTRERRMEMETGYGLEGVLPDGWLGSMQAAEMVPAFRAGDYARGLEDGLAAIDERLRRFPDDARLGAKGPLAAEAARARAMALGGGVVGAGAVGGTAAGLFLAVARRRRRERTCEQCDVYMPMLDEDDDDRHLTPGQRDEERVGSIDWQVHQCPRCDAVHTFESGRWFSGYRRCDRCRYRTRSSRTHTVLPATYHSGGRIRITEACAHCGATSSYERSTPPLHDSTSRGSGGSSGGGGGGSSFGGGRSGGGGAGSSW